MKSQVAQSAQGLIEYISRGEGPVVLVCHGTSSDCFSTVATEPLLAAGFRVVTPSRPGYGRTPLAAGQTAAQAARALAALLDCLEVETAAVLATSGGGPTGLALAADYPARVTRLILAAAISCPEHRPREPGYKTQTAFYGPMHNLSWAMLGMMSRLSPRAMARQTLTIFSIHDPDDSMRRLSAADFSLLCSFYHGASSRAGALNDLTHSVGPDLLAAIQQPTLVIHSREDNSVPFSHADWSLKHIPHAHLCEGGFTGHFFWIGPDFVPIGRRMVAFLQSGSGRLN